MFCIIFMVGITFQFLMTSWQEFENPQIPDLESIRKNMILSKINFHWKMIQKLNDEEYENYIPKFVSSIHISKSDSFKESKISHRNIKARRIYCNDYDIYIQMEKEYQFLKSDFHEKDNKIPRARSEVKWDKEIAIRMEIFKNHLCIHEFLFYYFQMNF